MRLMLRSVSFFLTLIVGAIAFAFTAIEFPGVMRELIAGAQHIPAYISRLGLSDAYMVWVDVLLTGDKLVMLGFVAATRVVFALLGGLLGGGSRYSSEVDTPSETRAAWWGR